jgi:hypothetical protein
MIHVQTNRVDVQASSSAFHKISWNNDDTHKNGLGEGYKAFYLWLVTNNVYIFLDILYLK